MSEPEATVPPAEISSPAAPAPKSAGLPAEGSAAGASRFKDIRWQFIVLAIALLLILVAAITMLLGRRDGREASVRPQNIPVIDSQVYTEAAVGRPRWVNPILATSQADRDLASLVYSGLTRIDEYGQPIPDLAESWEVSRDGLTYTFHLRSGIAWHDGAPFSADDVAFTMSLLRDPAFPGSADLARFWRTVETYAVDDLTVQFVLTQPLASFPEYAGIGLLPAHILAGIDPAVLPDDPINWQPVGTGPLWWESMQEDGGVVTVTLRPYDRFFEPSRRVQLDGVVFRFYDNASEAFQALSEVQGYPDLSPTQLDAALSSETTGLNLYASRLPVYGVILFNQQNAATLPFFQDQDVRLALLLALDREQIVADALGSHALVANSTILPGTWAYHPNLPAIPQDNSRAALLLDQAGWTLQGGTRAREDVSLAFTLLVSDSEADQQIGDAVAAQWRALGIEVRVEATEPADLLARIQTPAPGGDGRSFEAALVEFNLAGLADPDPYPFWHQSQAVEGQNYSGLADRDISEALEIARKDPNGVRRTEMYRNYQEWFLERAAAILLYNPVYHYAVSCQVSGVQMVILRDPSDRFRNLSEWRILPPATLANGCPE